MTKVGSDSNQFSYSGQDPFNPNAFFAIMILVFIIVCLIIFAITA